MAGKFDEYGLTQRQRGFCDDYLATQNATRSFLANFNGYGYDAASVTASQLLRKPKIDVYIQMRREEIAKKTAYKYDVSADRIMQELVKLAFLDPKKMVNKRGKTINPHKMGDAAAAIAGIDYSTDGQLKYKLANKLTALDLLMKAQGMYEKHQQQGAAVTIIKVPELKKEEGSGE